MTNNDILIRVRYALNITDLTLVKLFALSGRPLSLEEIRPLFLKEDEPGHIECDGPTLAAFLEGLVALKRGSRPETQEAVRAEVRAEVRPPKHQAEPSNNDILKALRIALQLRDSDILDAMALAGFTVTKSELGALFRRKDQDNYRPCGDQFLRNFLAGITKKYRV